MAIREILKVGHPMLARKAEPVETVDEGIARLAGDMVETMRAAPGIGLAAPQVNVGRRVIVLDLSLGERPEDLIVLINPEILLQEGEVVCEEGCLSVPDIHEKVARPSKVVVRGLNLAGQETEVAGEDLLARVLCHEIDHLEGKLFIDRLSSLKRAIIRKKLKRAEEKVPRL